MFAKTLRDWSGRTNERQKLQTFYAAVALGALLIAGTIGLIDRELGLSILNVAYVASLIWVINFVVWAIYLATQSNESQITEKPASRTKRSK